MSYLQRHTAVEYGGEVRSVVALKSGVRDNTLRGSQTMSSDLVIAGLDLSSISGGAEKTLAASHLRGSNP